MPRTRVDATHEDKVGEIVAAAARRLREQGAAGLSVAAIARELGVAQNTVYWYFPSRDHLFVAALQRVFGEMIQLKRAQDLALADEIVWFVDQLHAVAPLRAAMFERARESAVVAEFAGQLQAMLRLMLGNALRPHVGADRVEDVVGVFSATVEGLLLQQADSSTRERLLRVALDALTGGTLSG